MSSENDLMDSEEKKSDEKHNVIVEKFNLIIDLTSSFIKSIFPPTIRFVISIKNIFVKKEKSKEENN